MRNQSSLVILAVALLVICQAVTDDKAIDEIADNKIDTNENFKPDPKIPKAMDPRFNKMLPKLNENQLDAAVKAEKVTKAPKASTTEKAVKDETSTHGKRPIIIYCCEINFQISAFSFCAAQR